ncbi:MAG: type II toxin-antitoxin system death-on-curing family toxin [Xenococcaceae cyanobacterium MO_188.B19]|nr:type II toxin-antitoxin system death-on-curing family toxin [Xenococcaceae cyanobacterium MO_188.B19]
MSRVRFLTIKQVRAIHQQQILIFGGSPGILDEGKLKSAVFRGQNLSDYNEKATIYDLAASIGWGIANNYAFVDGNKRTAFVVMAVFLQINGIILTGSEVDVVNIMLAVASSQISQEQLSDWLRESSI